MVNHETTGIETKELRMGALRIIDVVVANIAVAFLRIPGTTHGNLRESFQRVGLEFKKLVQDFETVGCAPLRRLMKELLEDLSYWPTRSRVLRDDCAINTKAAADALKDAFRKIARKDVEDELGPVPNRLPKQLLSAHSKHSAEIPRQATEPPMNALEPKLTLARRILDQAQAAVVATRLALRQLRARVTGDPECFILRAKPYLKWAVLACSILLGGFELLLNARINAGTKMTAFATAVMAVITLNGLAVVVAVRAAHLLGYCRTLWMYRSRRIDAEDYGRPFPPEGPTWVVGLGGIAVLAAALYVLVAHRTVLIAQNEILQSNELTLALTTFGVVLAFFIEITLTSPYPQHYADMEDRLVAQLAKDEEKLRDANDNLAQLTLEAGELDREAAKQQREQKEAAMREAEAERRAQVQRDAQANLLDTDSGREVAKRLATQTYKGDYTAAVQPIRNAVQSIAEKIVRLNLESEQYTAAQTEIIHPEFLKACDQLIQQISSRDPKCGLRKLDRDPQAYKWAMDTLRENCRPGLTAYSDEFLLPAFRPSITGEAERIDGPFSLADAIAAFQRCAIAVDPPITAFELLYEEIRAEVRDKVLHEQALRAMVREGVGAEQPPAPPPPTPQIEEGSPNPETSRLNAPEDAPSEDKEEN